MLVFTYMTLTQIQDEIEQTSERRTELWHVLSEEYNPEAAAELKRLTERLGHPGVVAPARRIAHAPAP